MALARLHAGRRLTRAEHAGCSFGEGFQIGCPVITHIVVVDVVVGAEDVERDVANGLELELRGRALAVDVDRCNAVLRRQGVG